MPPIQEKLVDLKKSKARRDATGKITALRIVYTDGTETTFTADEIASADKAFDEGADAQETYNDHVDAFEAWSKSPSGIMAQVAEEFGFNLTTISEITHKERTGIQLTTEERTTLQQFRAKSLEIQDAIDLRKAALEDTNRVMTKVAEIRKVIGEIFKFSSDTQEKIVSATWFSGDGAMILSGIPGVGKSIAGYERVLIRHRGKMEIKRIEELYNMRESFEVPSIGKNHKVIWSRVRAVTKHESPARLIKVTTRTGRSVVATKDHSFLLPDGTGVLPVRGSELRVGDPFPVCRNLTVPGNAERWNIRNGRQRERNGLLYPVHDRGHSIGVPQDIPLDVSVGDMLGGYLAEGRIERGNYVRVTNDDISYRRRVSSYPVSLGVKPHDTGRDVIIGNQILARAIEEIAGNGSGNKVIPAWMLDTPEAFRLALLSSYLDGDGSVSNGAIEYTTKSRELAEGMSLLMATFGVVPTIKPKTVNGETYWRCVVPQGQSYLLAKKLLLKGEKGARLRKVPAPKQQYTDAVVNFGNVFHTAILKCHIAKGWLGNQVRKITKKQFVGRETARRYLERIIAAGGETKCPDEVKTIKTLVEGDILMDRISSIEEVDGEGYVYDLSVEGTENFMLANGMFVHNSQYIETAMLLLCNGMSRTEILQARRQYERFKQLETQYKEYLATIDKDLKAAIDKRDAEAQKRLTADRIAVMDRSRRLKERFSAFLTECRKKMKRHTSVVRLDPDKSIPGDETVVYRRNGVVNAGEIGELVDGLFVEDWERRTIGDAEFLHGDFGIEVPTVSPEGRVEWQKVTYASRHDSPEHLYKIRTVTGREVTMTGDHSALVVENGKIVKKRGDQIEVGDRVPSLRHLPNSVSTFMMSMGQYIETHQQYKLGDLPRDIVLGERFGEILGFIVSEGHVSDCMVEVTQRSSLEWFCDLCEQILGYRPRNERTQKGQYRVRIHRTPFTEFIRTEIGDSSATKHLPSFTWTAPVEFRRGLLRGYFRGDGHFINTETRADRTIGWCTKSKRLHMEIMLELARQGIGTSTGYNDQRGYGRFYRGRILDIEKFEQDIVNRNVSNNRMRAWTDTIPIPESVVDNIISTLGKYWVYHHPYWRALCQQRNTSRVALIKNLSATALPDNIQRPLESLAHSDIIYDRVVSVEVVPKRTEKVYDLTVPGNETFLAGIGGVFVHNSPEEVFYYTEVSLKDVTPGTAKEQKYAFKPMPRDIVLKPVKFFNEANRMNTATQDAVLGLMAEHEIEYLGEVFGSPNDSAKFVDSVPKESWLWTENIDGEEPAVEVPFDANINVCCPKHKVELDGKETDKTLAEMSAKERNELLGFDHVVRQLPVMTFAGGEWHCSKDAAHVSKKPSPREVKTTIEYVACKNPITPWMTIYHDKGQIVWFDTNPHVPTKLDLATVDRLDASIIFPALKLGGKSDLLEMKFPHGEMPIGEKLTEIAMRRILTWPIAWEEKEGGIDPLTYDELRQAWEAVRKMVDPRTALPAITLISEVFTAKSMRYRAEGNEGNPDVYADTETGTVPTYSIGTPTVRRGRTGAGGAAARDNWGSFVDLSVFEDPARRADKALMLTGAHAEQSGVPRRNWPPFEVTRAFGTRAAESMTKFAKALAFLEACDLAKPGDNWRGAQLRIDHVLTVIPYIYSHRIWTQSEGARGVTSDGKMMQIYPNVEVFLEKEIVDGFLKVTDETDRIKLTKIEKWSSLFESVKDWVGETDETGMRWVRQPNKAMIEQLSPQNNDTTLLDPIQNAIYDYAVYSYKEATRPMVLNFRRRILEMATAVNFTRAEVTDLERDITDAQLTSAVIEPATGGDETALMKEILENLRKPFIDFAASTEVSRRIYGYLLYIRGLPGLKAEQRGKIDMAIEGTGLVAGAQIGQFTYNNRGDKMQVEIFAGTASSLRTNQPFASLLKIRLESPDKMTAVKHIEIWNALRDFIDDPEAKTEPGRTARTVLSTQFSENDIEKIHEYVP